MMHGSRRFLLSVISLTAMLGAGGCSSLGGTVSDKSDSAVIPVPATPPMQPRMQARTPTASAACPQTETTYRVCDLTRPWRDRICLMPAGGACRPGGAR